MTTPPPPPQQGSKQQQAVLAAAAVLATAATVADAVVILAPIFAALKIRREALHAALSVVMERPPDRTGFYGPATGHTARLNLVRRAQFLFNSARRFSEVLARVASGAASPREILAQMALERRYYGQHQEALWTRMQAAARVDTAVMEHGLLLGWYSVNDARTSAECRAANRHNFRADDPPAIGYPGAVHPHCFPAGTKIVSPSARAEVSRWYAGDFVEIKTADARHITVTPNHPVLTSHGWVPAGQINDQSYVVRALDPSAACAASDPDEHEVVALIEDVLGAGLGSPGVMAAGVPVSAVDFHGDGIEHQIAVVRADRELMHGLQAGQPFGVEHFQRTAEDAAMLGLGDLGTVFGGLPGAPDGGMSRHGIACMLLGGAVRRHQPVGFGGSPQRHSGGQQTSFHGPPGHCEASSERVHRLASFIALDQVIQVRRFREACHVYNLQTVTGWYTASTIIVHNCRCVPGMPIPGAPMVGSNRPTARPRQTVPV